MFGNSNDESSETVRNPVSEEMKEEIKNLIANYIPPFIERYSDRLKEIEKEDIPNTINELNERIIKEMGITSIDEPLTKFIMHSVSPKIESILSSQETIRAQSLELANQTISYLINNAVEQINDQIHQLIISKFGLEQVAEDEETEEDAFIAEVIGKFVEIVDDEQIDSKEEYDDTIMEYPEIVTGTVDLPVEETIKPVITDFSKIKEQLTAKILEKYVHRIEEKFPDIGDQLKAKELFKKRIETVVEENLKKNR